MIFQARGVTWTWPGSGDPTLNGVDLDLPVGALVALVGPNGSGKTTLLRVMLGAVRPDQGQVLLQGRPVTEWPREAMARIVGVLPQREESAFPMTVMETVLLGRYAHLGPIRPVGASDRAAARDALERCDAWRFRDRFTHALSAGEWQRVRLARALAQEPQVLVLDEPTSALDVRHEMELFELIRRLVNEGLGCLLVTHHLNLAARYADRMVLLENGRVVATGSPAEVLREEVLTRTFEWPVRVTHLLGVPQVHPLRPGEEENLGAAGSMQGRVQEDPSPSS